MGKRTSIRGALEALFAHLQPSVASNLSTPRHINTKTTLVSSLVPDLQVAGFNKDALKHRG